MTGAEDLAVGLLTGIGQADPDLAVALDSPDLRAVCEQLAHLLWTPLMLERWASHPRWSGASPRAVMAALGALRLPPEAPRSVVPARQDICPEHQVETRNGTCDHCAGSATPGPPPGWRQRADTSPAGIHLTATEGANA